jgi:hypothetical protein
MVLLLTSCSFLERRKSHYSYIEHGIDKSEVIKKSGTPKYKNIANDSEVYVYEYCQAPYWKEVVYGLLTYGLYATSCSRSMVEMKVYFSKDKLVGLEDNSNKAERAAANANFARAMSTAADGVKTQEKEAYQIKPKKSVTCRDTGYGETTCTED